MRLNQFEKNIVKHPLRFWVQNKIEAPLISSMFNNKPICTGSALEIGCGFGNGIALIKKQFNPEKITAIDFDIEMIIETSQRYPNKEWLTLTNADGTDLPFKNNSFDMVFNFAVFHHIPNWQQAVKEVYRVLKPNGYFVIEDLYRAAICNPISKRVFEHPQSNRFNHSELITELLRLGFVIETQRNFVNLAGSILARR